MEDGKTIHDMSEMLRYQQQQRQQDQRNISTTPLSQPPNTPLQPQPLEHQQFPPQLEKATDFPRYFHTSTSTPSVQSINTEESLVQTPPTTQEQTQQPLQLSTTTAARVQINTINPIPDEMTLREDMLQRRIQAVQERERELNLQEQVQSPLSLFSK